MAEELSQAPVDDSGQADAAPVSDDSGQATDTHLDSAEAPDTGTTDAEPSEDSFFDPKAVPDALKPAYKQMQGAFTRKMQEIAQSREKVAAFDQFVGILWADFDVRAQPGTGAPLRRDSGMFRSPARQPVCHRGLVRRGAVRVCRDRL